MYLVPNVRYAFSRFWSLANIYSPFSTESTVAFFKFSIAEKIYSPKTVVCELTVTSSKPDSANA